MKAPIASESQLHELVIELLSHIAPEVDAGTIDPNGSIQDQLDIDSIDFLNFIMAVHEKTGIDVPERDYAKIGTVNDCVGYLAAKAG